MKMSENNDYIQLPPLKKDTPSDVVAFMWKYMKVPENSREKVKNLLKDANENGVKLSHQAPTLYDVVPKEEITEFEELIRKTIADIVVEVEQLAAGLLDGLMLEHGETGLEQRAVLQALDKLVLLDQSAARAVDEGSGGLH